MEIYLLILLTHLGAIIAEKKHIIYLYYFITCICFVVHTSAYAHTLSGINVIESDLSYYVGPGMPILTETSYLQNA